MAKKRLNPVKVDVLRALQKEIRRLGRQHTLLRKTDPDIFEKTLATFESIEKSALWLSRPQIFAGKKTPAELAQTEQGRTEIINKLAHVEYTVPP